MFLLLLRMMITPDDNMLKSVKVGKHPYYAACIVVCFFPLHLVGDFYVTKPCITSLMRKRSKVLQIDQVLQIDSVFLQ